MSPGEKGEFIVQHSSPKGVYHTDFHTRGTPDPTPSAGRPQQPLLTMCNFALLSGKPTRGSDIPCISNVLKAQNDAEVRSACSEAPPHGAGWPQTSLTGTRQPSSQTRGRPKFSQTPRLGPHLKPQFHTDMTSTPMLTPTAPLSLRTLGAVHT